MQVQKENNNKNDVIEKKQRLLEILFKDVDREHCRLDFYIESYLVQKKAQDNIDDEVLKFWENKRDKLIEIYEAGEILFFRKYAYEKVLNDYLRNRYKVKSEKIGYSIFESNTNQKKLENNQSKEKVEKEEIKTKSKEKKRPENQNDRRQQIISEWDRVTAKLISKGKAEEEKSHAMKISTSYKVKLANSYKISMDSLYKIEEKIKKHCKGKNTCSCIQNNIECEPCYIGCNYYNEFKSMLMKKSQTMNQSVEIRKDIHKKKQQIKKQESQNISKKKQHMKIKEKDFVVRGNVFKCMHDKHKIQDIDATVKVINEKDVVELMQVPAGYCGLCKIFFMMESVYESLKRKGIILCRISDEKTYIKNASGNGMKLAQESILMQYGYNVSKIESLSSLRRQKILAVIVDNQVLSKNEIISYLDFFINQRKGQSKFEVAIAKWNADKEFIEQYKVGKYSQYGVKRIRRT